MGRLSFLFLAAVFAVAFAGIPHIKRAGVTPLGIPWMPEIRDQNWVNRHNGFVDNSMVNAANISVLFYGDSITDSWDNDGIATYNQYYAPLGTANYGISGDRTEHVLWRIINQEVYGLTPKICVLKIGTNNLGTNTDEHIARGIAAITDALRSRLPNTKILLLGVLPRTNEANTVRTENINKMVSILDNGNSIRYLNMIDTFYQGNGTFNTELYTSDLLHLTAAGYAAWAGAMNPLFNEMYSS